jgi:hypothetical protein
LRLARVDAGGDRRTGSITKREQVVMPPRAGDVLVSTPTATIDHHIYVVAEDTDIACANYEAAVHQACELAKAAHVDAWVTEDHTHFRKVASYRADDDRA